MTNTPAEYQSQQFLIGQQYITTQGLVIDDPELMSDLDWLNVKEAIRRLWSVNQWAVADYLAKRRTLLDTQAWYAEIQELANNIGKGFETLRIWSIVSDNWPMEYRVPTATFSHHAKVPLKLGTFEERRDWLEAFIEHYQGDKIPPVRLLEQKVSEALSDDEPITEDGHRVPSDRQSWHSIGITEDLLHTLGEDSIAEPDACEFTINNARIRIDLTFVGDKPVLTYTMKEN